MALALKERVVTGERAVTAEGGFNPSWQRHTAEYKLAAPFLPHGKIVDVGCGVGHGTRYLEPRDSVGVDIDPQVLAGQSRPTVVADMRALPFSAGTFDGAISVHAIEHVPDPERAIAELRRVVRPGGVACVWTPNRLTFGVPDEIIDPYHYVEFAPDELRALAELAFDRVEIYGLFASDRYMDIHNTERVRLQRLLALDPLKIRKLIPRRIRQRLYDWQLTRSRATPHPNASAITVDDFYLCDQNLDECLDVLAVCHAGEATTANGGRR